MARLNQGNVCRRHHVGDLLKPGREPSAIARAQATRGMSFASQGKCPPGESSVRGPTFGVVVPASRTHRLDPHWRRCVTTVPRHRCGGRSDPDLSLVFFRNEVRGSIPKGAARLAPALFGRPYVSAHSCNAHMRNQRSATYPLAAATWA